MIGTSEEISAAVRSAGIVGANIVGFQAHSNLQPQVNTYIANGCECEPLIATNKILMTTKADRLVAGLIVAMKATGASQGIIGVQKGHEDVLQAIRMNLPEDGSIRIHLLENYYPAGDEFLLVHEATGFVIPEGGTPQHVGVTVNNVASLVQISEAVEGKVVTDQMVTIAGEVRKPQVVAAAVGMSYRDLIAIAGGKLSSDVVWLDGGPLSGKIISDLDEGISKKTIGILGLKRDSLIVQQKQMSLSTMVNLSKASCTQCMRCTDLCPRNLLGHEIFPHQTMRTIDYNLSEPTADITSAYLCSQCGICELVACDVIGLSPKKIYAAYKEELVRRGVKNPHNRSEINVHSQLENRKISEQSICDKLGLGEYSSDFYYGGKVSPRRVRIPISKHLGSSSILKISIGKKVHIGELVAIGHGEEPDPNYHASIAGEVTDINESYIEITG